MQSAARVKILDHCNHVPLPGELGTYKRVRTRFWSWRENPSNLQTVPSRVGPWWTFQGAEGGREKDIERARAREGGRESGREIESERESGKERQIVREREKEREKESERKM